MSPQDSTWLVNRLWDHRADATQRRPEVPLEDEQAAQLMRQMHYCRWRVWSIVNALEDSGAIERDAAERIIAWQRRAIEFRNVLFSFLIAQIYKHACRYRIRGHSVDDLASDFGCAVLMTIERRPPDQFAYLHYYMQQVIRGRAYKLCQANKTLARVHGTQFDPGFMGYTDHEGAEREEQRLYLLDQLRSILAENKIGMTDDERRILYLRFHLNGKKRYKKPTAIYTIAERVNMSARDVLNTLKELLARLRWAIDRVMSRQHIVDEVADRIRKDEAQRRRAQREAAKAKRTGPPQPAGPKLDRVLTADERRAFIAFCRLPETSIRRAAAWLEDHGHHLSIGSLHRWMRNQPELTTN